MTPGRIAIGLLGAIIAAGARGAVRLSVALALSVAMLTACSTTTEVRQAPDNDRPVSALRMYEAGIAEGRKRALDDLRATPAFSEPVDLGVCPNKVSWLPRKLDIPEDIWIGSRKEDMELKKACRDGEIEKASIIRRQREALESAE